jgi:alkyl hydroperoxide reductase subunit AhpC
VRFVQIVDASSANFLTRTIWKRMLLKKSREAGIPIYADWKGSLIGRLGLVRGTSNVLIIDREGVLRYREVGPIQSEKLNRFYSILDELTGST